MLKIIFIVASVFGVCQAQVWGITPQNQAAYLNVGGDAPGLWTLAGQAFTDHHTTTLIQIGDIDTNANTFYIIGLNRTDSRADLELIGVSLVTGQIASTTDLPFAFSLNYVNTPGVDWIPDTHDVLVYGLNKAQTMFEILRVTPGSTKTTQIATWANEGQFIQSVDSYDTTRNVLWVQTEMNNQLTLSGFNISSGEMVYNLTDMYGFQSINYDSQKQRVIGLAAPNNGNTPVVALDDMGDFTVIGEVTGMFTMAGPNDAAFDISNRLLYQYVDDGTTVQLLVVNVDSATSYLLPYTEGSSVTPVTVCFSN